MNFFGLNVLGFEDFLEQDYGESVVFFDIFGGNGKHSPAPQKVPALATTASRTAFISCVRSASIIRKSLLTLRSRPADDIHRRDVAGDTSGTQNELQAIAGERSLL